MVVCNEEGEVRAAGGVVCRTRDDGSLEVLLVHRPQYGDWTIPKGKVEEGETDEACAVREVEEECGVRGELGEELPTVRWRDRFDRPKVARYWRIDVSAEAASTAGPQHEVDQVVWLRLPDAIARLTYPRDADVLRALLPTDQTAGR
jgi:8-oxo-dGTP pyrophosphatase MutT (NUDIX family)